jgi:agmatine deiminase
MAYRMPAEWEPHEGVWLAWPHEKTDWPGKFAPIPWVYGEILKRLSHVERVHILITRDNAAPAQRVLEKSGAKMDSVDFFLCPTNRSWTRDFCPQFVKDAHGATTILDWRFNGWAKYPNWNLDDAVPARVAKRLKIPAIQPVYKQRRVVLEGGSIDVNGAGALLTTEECLLSPVQARNPGLTRSDLEQIFQEYLGITRTIWLKNGIEGDDTHGHVDDLARFVDPGTVVIVRDGSELLEQNIRLLRREKDLRIVMLPMPEPLYFAGQRLPASYANFYIANNLVLVPTFNDPNDRVALNTIAKLMPSHEVVGIYCGDLVLGLGTLHCMTQQQIA